MPTLKHAVRAVPFSDSLSPSLSLSRSRARSLVLFHTLKAKRAAMCFVLSARMCVWVGGFVCVCVFVRVVSASVP